MLVLSTGLLLHWCIPLVVASTSIISCNNKTFCQHQLGKHSECSYEDGGRGTCTCDEYYYLPDGDNQSCQSCPGIGESCVAEGCCGEEYLVCNGGVCACFYSDYCWGVSDSERARFQRVAQGILAVALLLTTTILFILFWRACTRRSEVQRQLRSLSAADSFLSLNSLQRMVLLQLQDRPPPYNPECMSPWKDLTEITEPPPSYVDAVGQDNLMFFIGEYSSSSESQVTGSSRQEPDGTTVPSGGGGAVRACALTSLRPTLLASTLPSQERHNSTHLVLITNSELHM